MRPAALLRAAGGVSLLMALFHAGFWRLFGWPESLAALSPANRALPQVLNLNLMAVFLLLGLLFVVWPAELLSFESGRVLTVGVGVCYLARLIQQPIFFGFSGARALAVSVVCLVAALLHFGAVALARSGRARPVRDPADP